MNNLKFWRWKNQLSNKDAPSERTLYLDGAIAESSWFDDQISPKLFKDELNLGDGDITVWINSPGGDCVAAAQIYNMLKDYPGKVTVKIDGIAASAASVIAMAGDKTYVSPVSMLMIHNPSTIAMGDHAEMQKAIEMLDEVKESIINAYVLKTGLSRARLSHLMDAETWMNANTAIELGFADGLITRDAFPPEKKEEESEEETEEEDDPKKKDKSEEESEEDEYDESTEEEEKKKNSTKSMLFSRKAVNNALLNKLERHYRKPKTKQGIQAEIPIETEGGRSAEDIRERLDVMKKFIGG